MPITVIIATILVAVFAFILRRAASKRDTTTTPAPVADDSDVSLPPDPVSADEEDDDDASEGLIAFTSDGLAFVPRPHGVLIAPASRVNAARTGDEDAPAMAAGSSEPHAPVLLKAGDLIAARVRRGAPDLDPWRLETLGRDRDLTAWIFEVQEAAEAARELLAQRVVQPPRDELGDPIPVGDEDFWVAERELEQTLADLDRPEPVDDDEPRR
jgi:hypothetical protein